MTGDAALVHRHLLAVAEGSAPLLHAELARLGPLVIAPARHVRVADHLYVAIVNQQLSTKAADTIWGRIEAAATERAVAIEALFAPEHEPLLRLCGVSGNKARALTAVRRAADEGLLDRDRLAAMVHQERALDLTKIKGIGPWTADMVGIFFFNDPDIWPDGDVAARGMLRQLAETDDTIATAARFAPYRSWLARALWQIKDGGWIL